MTTDSSQPHITPQWESRLERVSGSFGREPSSQNSMKSFNRITNPDRRPRIFARPTLGKSPPRGPIRQQPKRFPLSSLYSLFGWI